MNEAIIEGLRTVPIFAALDDDAIARAAAIAGIDDHAKGSVLIERGLPGAGLFVILDGTVAIELHNRTVELGPGEFVGELSLLSEHTPSAAHAYAPPPTCAPSPSPVTSSSGCCTSTRRSPSPCCPRWPSGCRI